MGRHSADARSHGRQDQEEDPVVAIHQKTSGPPSLRNQHVPWLGCARKTGCNDIFGETRHTGFSNAYSDSSSGQCLPSHSASRAKLESFESLTDPVFVRAPLRSSSASNST